MSKQLESGGSKPAAASDSSTTQPPSKEELTAISHQMEEMANDVRSLKSGLKSVMKKDEMSEFIKDTVTKVMSEINENIDLMIDIKMEEKAKELKDKISELEEENDNLRSDVVNLKVELKTLKKQSEESDIRSKSALAKANYNEQYSRKNNVKIMNIQEKQDETIEGLTKDICDMMNQKGVDLKPEKIIAIHRIPGKQGLPRPVLLKLRNNNDKTMIMMKRKEFKNSNRLVDDVTKLNTELIQRLTEHSSIMQAWYFNGSVFGKTTSNRRLKFDLFDNIESVLRSK